MRSGWPDRVRQFRRAVAPRFTPSDREFAAQWLTRSEQALFDRMSLYERQHSAALARQLLVRQPAAGRDLVAAALLHDLGKAEAQIGPTARVVYVLLAALPGRLPDRWLTAPNRPLPRPLDALWVLRQHAHLGAEAAHRAGISPRVAWLIEHHHDAAAAVDDLELRSLQAVDVGEQ